MADNVIKGITIEIGGDTAPLSKALYEVNKESRSIQNELKAVEKLLKLDPSNTELVAQKQKLLGDAVNAAKTKLDALKQAQEEVNKKVASGEIDKGSQEYRNLQRQVIVAEQALQKAETAQEKYSIECETSKNATSTLKRAISEQEAELSALKKRYTEVVLTQGENSKEAKALKKEYETLDGELSENKKRLEEAGIESEKAGKKAKSSGDDAKEGGSGWQKFGELAQKAGKVAVAGVTAIAAGATAAGKAVWDMAQDTAAATDAIDKQSQAVGLSRTAYQEYDYILSQNGMSIEKMTGVSKTLTQQMDAVTEGNKNATANFEKLGLSVYDSTGKLKSQEQMLAESISALQGMEDGTEKARLATELFGKQGQSLMPLLNGEAGSFEKLRQKAHDLGMVLTDETVNAGVQFTDSLDTLKRTFSGVKDSIMGNMLPGLTQLTTGFTELISGSEGAGDTIKAAVSSMISSFGEVIPQFLTVVQVLIEAIIGILPDVLTTLVTSIIGWTPSLLETILRVLQSLILAITGNVQMIVNAVLQILTTVATFIIQNIPLIVNAALQIVAALIQGIAASIPSIIKVIVDMIPKLIQAITDNLPLIINAGITLILSLVQGLLDAIPQLLDALPTIIDALLNGILSAIPLLIDAGIQLLTSIVAALPTIISKIVEVLPQIITSIITALMNNLPLLIEAGIKLFLALITAMPTIVIEIVKAIPMIVNGLVSGIVKSIPQMIEAGKNLLMSIPKKIPEVLSYTVAKIGGLLKGAKDAILNFIPQMANAGLNLIKGLWNGISDAGAWLWNKISGFFGGVVDKIKDFFGIHSPSTLFRDMIGKNLVKGIEVGVDVETPNLQDNLEENLSAATKGLKATVEAEEMKLNAAGRSGGLAGVSLGGLHFEIGTFINNTEKDLQQLVEEGMEIAEEYMRRRGGAFA